MVGKSVLAGLAVLVALNIFHTHFVASGTTPAFRSAETQDAETLKILSAKGAGIGERIASSAKAIDFVRMVALHDREPSRQGACAPAKAIHLGPSKSNDELVPVVECFFSITFG